MTFRLFAYLTTKLQYYIEQPSQKDDEQGNGSEENAYELHVHHFLEHGGFWQGETYYRHHERQGCAQCNLSLVWQK